MWRPLVLGLVAFLFFSTFQFVHIVSPSSQSPANVQAITNSAIENGGFEQGLTGWANGGDGFLAVSGDNAHSGNYSLEISSSINQQAYFYQFVDMPNASFVFSFWIFRVNPKSWTACYLARDWDGNTARVVSSLVIQDDTIELNAWDNPYAPGRQVFNYDVTVGIWHNVTFEANSTSETQDFFIDGNLIENLNSSSGNVFSPNVLIFGDVSTDSCNGTFYFDDFELNALDTANMYTSISIKTESQSNIVGFAVNISGTLTDMYGVALKDENVVLYYSVRGVDFWSPIASDSTDNLGNYYVQWIPSATGYFVVKAVYAGNSTYVGTSNNITLSILPYGNEYVFSVESNSSISNLNFDTQNTTLSFEVSGAEGTTGYVRVTLAKNLAPDISKLRIQVDSSNCNYVFQETDASWIVSFTYTHSVHQVYINLGQETVDEFSPFAFSLLLLTVGALLALFSKRSSQKRT
jgi:hypothetical protein